MDSNRSIYDVKDQLDAAAAAAGGGGLAGGQPTSAAAALPDYLESGRKHCESEQDNHFEPNEKGEEEKYEVLACGCRSRFCKNCCVGLGLSLRERLLPVLETFTGLLMWTFTVDPKLFSSPAEAFKYVRDNRCISNVMRELRKRGYLHTGRYFVVVEWQMGTGDQEGTLMAHWHLLADASFIPFDTVCALWNRYRPAWAGPVEGDRPGFGSVRFTAPHFDSALHAGRYACKYLIKYPEKGYPDWVLESHDIHRFSTSRGFWGDTAKADELPEPDSDQAAPGDDTDSAAETESAPRTTIRERLAKCGEQSVVMRTSECVDQDTGELTRRRQFVMGLDASLKTVAESVRRILSDGARRLEDLPRSALFAMRQFRVRKTA